MILRPASARSSDALARLVLPATLALVGACGAEGPARPATAGEAPADPWKVAEAPDSPVEHPRAAEAPPSPPPDPGADRVASGAPPPPAAPSPAGAKAPAAAPDPCARYAPDSITCSGSLRAMNDCRSARDATAEDRRLATGAKLRRCYQRELSQKPDLSPRGELAFTEHVDPNGCVLRATPLRADPSYPPSLVRCIAEAIGLGGELPKDVAIAKRTRSLAAP